MIAQLLPIYPKRPNQLPEARYLLGQYKHIEPCRPMPAPRSISVPMLMESDVRKQPARDLPFSFRFQRRKYVCEMAVSSLNLGQFSSWI